ERRDRDLVLRRVRAALGVHEHPRRHRGDDVRRPLAIQLHRRVRRTPPRHRGQWQRDDSRGPRGLVPRRAAGGHATQRRPMRRRALSALAALAAGLILALLTTPAWALTKLEGEYQLMLSMRKSLLDRPYPWDFDSNNGENYDNAE